MKRYSVKSMTCAACSARVEKAVTGVDGVEACAVSLLDGSMSVEGKAAESEIINAVRAAGYDAFPEGSGGTVSNGRSGVNDNGDFKSQLRRLIISAVLLSILMVLSMGRMAGIPLPDIFDERPAVLALTEMIISACVMIIGHGFFVRGINGLIRRAPNMDTLVSLGSSAAFIYSTVIVYEMLIFPEKAPELKNGLYFESAAMIPTLITLGKMLEARAKGKTTSALKSLTALRPAEASVVVDGEEKKVRVEQVKVGDVFVLRPGESIPLDGTVIDGSSSVNEAALTGESIPVDKNCGDSVAEGTLNLTGVLKCRVTRTGDDTSLSRIIKAVRDASATKAPIARTADRISGIFVPIVIAAAVVTSAVWLIAGESAGFALARGISVLVVSCPCALGLATPVAVTVGSGVGARNGILFKTAASLEAAGRVTDIAFDKTGTVTCGQPAVTDIVPACNVSENELLLLAAALEYGSEHPIGKAIVKEAGERGIVPHRVSDFTAVTGSGVTARYGNSTLFGGSKDFIYGKTHIDGSIEKKVNELSDDGKTPVLFVSDGRFIGLIGVADKVRDDSAGAISELGKMGVNTALVTGDNERTAKAIAAQIGISKVYASASPEGKAEIIAGLSGHDGGKDDRIKTAMVGDGINDAPALTSADVGIAIGTGTDIAAEAADIVLMGNGISEVCSAVMLGRATLRNIRQNLFWAFFYNVLGIPLAAGVFIPIFGWKLSPGICAFAMSLSSFCVVSNALRLNSVRLYENGMSVKNNKGKRKEKTNMESTVMLNVKGMMCEHCEAHVKKALEALPQVKEAAASHEKGTVEVTLFENVSRDTLVTAIEGEGYTVID